MAKYSKRADGRYQYQFRAGYDENGRRIIKSFYGRTVAELEAKMGDIEKVLAAPTPDVDIVDLTRAYLELNRDLDAKMDEWASL